MVCVSGNQSSVHKACRTPLNGLLVGSSKFRCWRLKSSIVMTNVCILGFRGTICVEALTLWPTLSPLLSNKAENGHKYIFLKGLCFALS